MMLDPAGPRLVEEETRWQPPTNWQQRNSFSEFSGMKLPASRLDPETSSAQARSRSSPASARYM